MRRENNRSGLVICGGTSSRMGLDKSEITYYEKPQRYHVYDMLGSFCPKTFISCNFSQADKIDPGYKTLVDLTLFSSIGPMAGLLTAFTRYPHQDFIVVGCDYPFLNVGVLTDFLSSLDKKKIAGAFFNKDQQLYEPLLAWYSHRAIPALIKFFEQNQYSLQYFLQNVNAEKYYPEDPKSMTSVDTPAASRAAQTLIQKSLSSRSTSCGTPTFARH